MESNFDKIQPGMINGLKKTVAKKEVAKSCNENLADYSMPSFSGIEEAGTAGRSSVVMDNIDTDLRKLQENPDLCGIVNMAIEKLCKLGYSYEDAISVAISEFSK